MVNASIREYPDFNFEKKIWKKGFKFIAGCDEVGRGCFAGPVVAAAVVFSRDIERKTKEEIIINNKKVIINDSKKLTPQRRETADLWIRKNVLALGIGEVSASEINRVGMARSTKKAFRKAISNANTMLKKADFQHSNIDYLLLDAFFVPYVRGLPLRKRAAKRGKVSNNKNVRQFAIIHGDEKSFSIASASIIAKVYRDTLMIKIGERKRYKRYDWVNNKGYASKKHQEGIFKYGTTGYHRKQFIETFLKNKKPI